MLTRPALVLPILFLLSPFLVAPLAVADPLLPNPAVQVRSGADPIVVADFNNDGIDDLAIGERRGVLVSVFLGQGDGTFEETLPLSTPSSDLVAGDFNRDGKIDLATIGRSYGVVVIFIGRGDGTFIEKSRLTAGNFPYGIVALDLHDDGILSLAVVNHHSADLYFYAGNGDATFAAPVVYPSVSRGNEIETTDLNGDGLKDLVVCGNYDVAVFFGTASDTFVLQPPIATEGEYEEVAIDDLDGDGAPDVIAVNDGRGAYPSDLQIMLNRGDGTFDPPVHIDTGVVGTRSAVPGDFDENGVSDLVAVSSGGQVLVFDGAGDGTFAPPVEFAVAEGTPNRLAIGEFNEDGDLDIVVTHLPAISATSSIVAILLGNGDGTFIAPIRQTSRGSGVVVGDLDGDEHPDIALSSTSNEVVVLFGSDDPEVVTEFRTDVGSYPLSIAMGEFNNDGRIDLVTSNRLSHSVSVVLNNGSRLFGPQVEYQVGINPWTVAVGDFNDDGIDDIATANLGGGSTGGDVSILMGLGDGTFSAAVQMTSGASPAFVATGDLDSDGVDDLVVGSQGESFGGGIRILISNGDGTFVPAVKVGQGGTAVITGDLDADGHLDLLWPLGGEDKVSVLYGAGDGTFPRSMAFAVGATPAWLSMGDFNTDGLVDVAASLTSYLGVTLLLGRPGGLLGPRQRFGAVGPTAAGDFNHDHRIDLVTGGWRGTTVLLNQGPFGDFDGDGITDDVDTCTDGDGDGFGDPWFSANICDTDNCPSIHNASQNDGDGDGIGDDCDDCPFDALNDVDRDGVCGDVDNCPAVANPDQADLDGDGIGDLCDDCLDVDGDGYGNPDVATNVCPDDNCPTISNPDQADWNMDGSGDACQPTIVITAIEEDGGDALEVRAVAEDPQGEAISGTIEVFDAAGGQEIVLPDIRVTRDCDDGFNPEGIPNKGIAYHVYGGYPTLWDLDRILGCDDRLIDYEMAKGTCADPQGSFSFYRNLGRSQLPLDLCVRRRGTHEGGTDLVVVAVEAEGLRIAVPAEPLLSIPFTGGLPRSSPISGLEAGLDYLLEITVTDGNTLPISAEQPFLYQGETQLLINNRPVAQIAAPASVECDRPAGGPVTLDGSGSSDPDSTPGTADDLVAYEWLLDPGRPNEVPLGSGVTLDVVLPVGDNEVGLLVIDSVGESDLAVQIISVVDTIPPALTCPAVQPLECTGPDGAAVSVVAGESDACSAIVIVSNDRTSGGADASGIYPLGLTNVTFSAVDGSGNMTACSSDVEVFDATPPHLSVSAMPPVLWPPNHRTVDVTAVLDAGDLCGPATVVLESLSSSEPDDADGNGDGKTTGDLLVVSDDLLQLRAERSGAGEGRVYAAIYRASDASGNGTMATLFVPVPHNVGGSTEPMIILAEQSVTGTLLSWMDVPQAVYHNVVRGSVDSVREKLNRYDLGRLECIAGSVMHNSTAGFEDGENPELGKAFIYLAEYFDGAWSGLGTESAAKERSAAPGQANCR